MTHSDAQVASNDKLIVKMLRPNDPLWETVESRTGSSVYHSRNWHTVLANAFEHQSSFLVALRDGELVDLLPAVTIRAPFLGTKIVSTPYEGSHGGFVSDDTEAHQLLIDGLKELATRVSARHIEVRSERPIDILRKNGFTDQQPLLVTALDLSDEKTTWNGLSAKHRRNVRRASKNGVTVRRAGGYSELCVFFEILHRHYHGLGLPFFSMVLFDEIWSQLIQNRRADLLIARIGEAIIGGHLVFYSQDELISKYSSFSKSDKFKKSYASYALFWEAIRLGINKKLTSFNMGVTGKNNTGLLDFKNRFGATTAPVHFYSWPMRRRSPDYSEYYGGYRGLKRAWQLLPKPWATRIGHIINTWIC
jgi:hypothetical protein